MLSLSYSHSPIISTYLYMLQASRTNNDPKVVAQYFVRCVTEYGHSPKLLRTDCGTENGLAAGIQAMFHSSADAHAYGKSTSNQRIEALWSKLRPVMQGWIDYFRQMVDNGRFHPGVTLETYALRRSFMALVNDTLTDFMCYWNTHRVRKSSDSPGGIPDVLFYTNQCIGVTPVAEDIAEAQAACHHNQVVTGDQDIDDYFKYVMEESHLHEPSNRADASTLYDALCDAARQQ